MSSAYLYSIPYPDWSEVSCNSFQKARLSFIRHLSLFIAVHHTL
jgi:hypothetical protein